MDQMPKDILWRMVNSKPQKQQRQQATHLDGVELDAGLHNIDGGEGAVGDGATDTTGGGTLEVVHEVVVLGAGGGHDGRVVGLHSWTIQVGGNSSKKIVVGLHAKAAALAKDGAAKKSRAKRMDGTWRRREYVRISPVISIFL